MLELFRCFYPIKRSLAAKSMIKYFPAPLAGYGFVEAVASPAALISTRNQARA